MHDHVLTTRRDSNSAVCSGKTSLRNTKTLPRQEVSTIMSAKPCCTSLTSCTAARHLEFPSPC